MTTLEKALGIVIAFMAVIGIMLIIPAEEKKITREKTATTMEDTLDSKTLKEFKREFMIGCDPDRDQTKYCECSYDKLVERYSLSEIYKMLGEVDDGELPDDLMEIAIECVEYTY